MIFGMLPGYLPHSRVLSLRLSTATSQSGDWSLVRPVGPTFYCCTSQSGDWSLVILQECLLETAELIVGKQK